MTTDTARRMLWGHYHGQPPSPAGQQEFLDFVLMMARKVLRGTDQENEDAAAEFSLVALDRAKHPTWLRLSEEALWKAVAQECYWFMRRTLAERFAENHHDICTAGQIARPRDNKPLHYVTTGTVAARLPNTAEIDKARKVFLDALDGFNSTEWPPNDRRAMAKHVLMFYDGLALPLRRNRLQRRCSLKQKEIAALFGLNPDVASRLLKKARDEQHPSGIPGEVLDEKLRAVLLKRLETILTNPARYQS